MVALGHRNTDKDHFKLLIILCPIVLDFRSKANIPRVGLDCCVLMLSDASIPSMLFLASTWWSKTEKADVLKITRCQQDPFAYRL